MMQTLNTFVRRYSVGIASTFALAAMLMEAVLSYRNFQDIARTADQVTRQYEVLLELESILSSLKDAETGLRGYVITGRDEYLRPYEHAMADIPTHVSKLESLFEDSPEQLGRLHRLRDNVDRRLQELRKAMVARREQGFDAARDEIAQDRGKAFMEAIRTTVSQMQNHERRKLEQRRIEADAGRSNATVILVSGSFVVILLAVSAFIVVHRHLAYQVAMEKRLTAANEELEQRVQHRTEALRATNESLRDEIAERTRLEEQARQFAVELQRSNKELEQFAFVASHDLQEPLRKIQAFSDRIKTRCADSLDAQGQDYLQRIVTATDRMRRLIEDLLAFSRVSTKGQAFAPVDLNQVLGDVVSDLEARLMQSGGRIDVGPLPTVFADGLQMAQLFQNLLANGLKFHRPDIPPVVRVSARRLPASDLNKDGGFEISVVDNGIGFENTYAERIFQLFQRLHGRSEYEGTGMGLAICRKIVERHGGTISAHSEPGQGATFILTLPAPHSE